MRDLNDMDADLKRYLEGLVAPFRRPNELARTLEQEAVDAWRQRQGQIPVRTGRLKASLIERTNPDRAVAWTGGTIRIVLSAPGAVYRPGTVPALPWPDLLMRALRRMRVKGGRA